MAENELLVAKISAEESERKYSYILENSPIGIFQRKLDDGGYTFCNLTLARHFQCETIEEFLANYNSWNKRWADTEKHDDFKRLLRIHNRLEGYEVRVVLIDGTIKWFSLYVQLNPETDFIIGFSLDVTERKNAERALLKSEERYHSLIDNLMHPVVVTSISGEFLYANQRAMSYFGLSHKDLLERKANNYWLNRSKRESFLAELHAKGFVNNFEIQFIVQNEISTVILSSNFIDFYGEKAILTIYNDITQQKKLEQQILNVAIETEEKERLHFAQELHDGLTPLLSAAKMYLQWIQQTTDKDDIPNLLNKALNIIDDSYRTSREISHLLSPHVLRAQGLISALKNIAEKLESTKIHKINILYNCDVEENCFQHFSLQKQTILYRILLECINNTIKHANATEINISFEKFEEKHIFEITYRDNGNGFDYQNMMSESKGIGLLNMKNRIELINGTFNIESMPQKGVLIKIILQYDFDNYS